MGATRRAWRAIERAQMKDAAKKVRVIVRTQREEALAVQAQALAIADTFSQESPQLVPTEGGLVYALGSELPSGE